MNMHAVEMQWEASGAGAPLVFVPGGLTGWLSWIPHAEVLATSRHVIRLQLLAVEWGLSNSPLPQDYSADLEIQALDNTLKTIGIPHADFAAWSYGAEIALSYAIHHPELVRSLTLIEPPAMWVLRSRGPLSNQLLEEQKIMQSFAADRVSEDQLAWFAHFAGFVPREVDPRSLPAWHVWSEHRQSLRIGDAPFRHEDDIEWVRNFQNPVLLLKGQGSAEYYHQILDTLAEAFPNARLETLPAGHAPHIISMAAFMEMFTQFIADIT